MYDESDENDDTQKFMTYKGTLFIYDRLNHLSLIIEHPLETVYTVVALESTYS